MSQVFSFERKVECKRCKRPYTTYLSEKICDGICNREDCFSKYIRRKKLIGGVRK